MPQQTFFRNLLPHITPLGGTFFITFRLADALPRSIVIELKEEYRELEKKLPAKTDPDYIRQARELREAIFGKYEYQLDTKPYGSCILKDPRVASILADRMQKYDGTLYELLAYCIMPNHVHLLIRVLPVDPNGESFTPLPHLMKLIKGGSAFQINRLLKKSGQFWCIDYFDRFIRDEVHLARTMDYIYQNPVKARLVKSPDDWPWTWRGDPCADTRRVVSISPRILPRD